MDFALTETQRDLQALARKILEEQAPPERLSALEKSGEHMDRPLWTALADAGLLGIAVPEAYGGMDLGYESLCLLLEEQGRTQAKLPLLSTLVQCALPMSAFADQTVCEDWLPAIVRGEKLLTAATLEPGHDDYWPRHCELKNEDGQWQLSGEKHCVPWLEQADAVLVTAQCEGAHAIVLVPVTSELNVETQTVTSEEQRSLIRFDALKVDDAQIIVKGGQAGEWIEWTEERRRAALCATALGLCDKMMRMSASYTSEREQFGRAVATFQAVSHRMADAFIDIECLRSVTEQAVSLLSAGQPATEAVAIAKIWCGDVCHRISQAAQHVHGGIGVDRDYPLHRYCLTAREIELSSGPSARLLEEVGEQIAIEFRL